MNYAVRLSYLGDAFSGWQRQPHAPSGQETIESALTRLNGDKWVRVVAAGRTDAGVHARGQVVSFQFDRDWEPSRFRLALNAHLPEGLRVVEVARVPSSFHARRSAQWREYVYFLWTAGYVYPHIAPYVWRNGAWGDLTVLKKACDLLEGTHDFSAFCRLNQCPQNARRTLYSVRLVRKGSLVRLKIRGISFLTNMMRIIVGNLDQLARGRRDLEWFKDLLAGGDRTHSARTAPPNGLFFWKVSYDPSPWKEPLQR